MDKQAEAGHPPSEARRLELRVPTRLAMVAAAGVAVASLAAALAMPAMAAGTQRFHDTTRIMEQHGTECASAGRLCRTIKSAKTVVGAGRSRIVSVSCPPGSPHVVGWDARHHEHIGLTLLSRPTVATGAAAITSDSPAAFTEISIAAVNHANAPGHAVIFLGCGRKAFDGGGFATNYGAVPSKHPRRAAALQ